VEQRGPTDPIVLEYFASTVRPTPNTSFRHAELVAPREVGGVTAGVRHV
jgi:hypothetical protein